MTGLDHPLMRAAFDSGDRQAEAFIERIESGVAMAADELASQLSMARFGSLERLRGFASRLQRHLIEVARDDS